MPETVCNLAHERPIYFYDQLGCGRSSRAADPDWYTPARYVEELGEVRRRLGLEACYLMGFSWGAMLAALYMLEKNPSGIRGLMLCAPYLGTPSWEADQRKHISRLPRDLREAIETAERSGEFDAPSYQDAMMVYYRRHLCLLEPWPASLQAAFTQLNPDVYQRLWGPSEFTVTGLLKDYDLMPRLGKITVPVLLTCGDQDEARVESVRSFQLALPCAAMAVIPNAAHLHQIEQPQIFLSIVRSFLFRLERNAT